MEAKRNYLEETTVVAGIDGGNVSAENLNELGDVSEKAHEAVAKLDELGIL